MPSGLLGAGPFGLLLLAISYWLIKQMSLMLHFKPKIQNASCKKVFEAFSPRG